jgi:hypothetical protein
MDLASLYKQYVPANARLFAESVLGNDAPITEKDFTQRDLSELRRMIEAKKQQNLLAEQRLTPRPRVQYTQFPNIQEGREVPYAEYAGNLQQQKDTYNQTRGKTSISYRDYPKTDMYEDSGWLEQLRGSLTQPSHVLETSLGQFNAYDTPDGMEVRDNYNWNPVPFTTSEAIRSIPEMFQSPEKMGNGLVRMFRPNINRPVNIKLK